MHAAIAGVHVVSINQMLLLEESCVLQAVLCSWLCGLARTVLVTFDHRFFGMTGLVCSDMCAVSSL
jgi:hypothetical protein